MSEVGRVDRSAASCTRDVCVAVFVVHAGRVLLHYHRKLGRWLPPGGHIEPHELPDEAAIREVLEETGVRIELFGDAVIDVDGAGQPRQLCRPAGIQLEDIAPGHQHIDLVYFATGEPAAARDEVDWFAPTEWTPLGLTDEVAAWCLAALDALSGETSIGVRTPVERGGGRDDRTGAVR